ncbi:hypothetical protein J3F83DRAFT_117468 [Trichoderma novae-zelandiae]
MNVAPVTTTTKECSARVSPASLPLRPPTASPNLASCGWHHPARQICETQQHAGSRDSAQLYDLSGAHPSNITCPPSAQSGGRRRSEWREASGSASSVDNCCLQLPKTQLALPWLSDCFENQPMSADKPPYMHCDSLLASSSSEFRSGWGFLRISVDGLGLSVSCVVKTDWSESQSLVVTARHSKELPARQGTIHFETLISSRLHRTFYRETSCLPWQFHHAHISRHSRPLHGAPALGIHREAVSASTHDQVLEFSLRGRVRFQAIIRSLPNSSAMNGWITDCIFLRYQHLQCLLIRTSVATRSRSSNSQLGPVGAS